MIFLEQISRSTSFYEHADFISNEKSNMAVFNLWALQRFVRTRVQGELELVLGLAFSDTKCKNVTVIMRLNKQIIVDLIYFNIKTFTIFTIFGKCYHISTKSNNFGCLNYHLAALIKPF